MSVIPSGPIDHVGIAVRDIDEACARYQRLLGAEPAGRPVVAAQGVAVAFLRLPGEARLELIAPLDETSPVHRFLERRGEGLHHVCILVDDIDTVLERLVAAEVPLVDACARPGAEGSRIAFLRPEALGGVLLELKQKAG